MSSYPGCNATLTEVRDPGPPDAHGDPTVGPIVWEGRADGYLRRVRGTRLAGGKSIDDTVDVFVLLDTDGGPIASSTGVTEGQRVVIEDRRTGTPATATFRLSKLEHRQGGGTVADSQRWELDPNIPET